MLNFEHFETEMQLRYPNDSLYIRNMLMGNHPGFQDQTSCTKFTLGAFQVQKKKIEMVREKPSTWDDENGNRSGPIGIFLLPMNGLLP